MPLVKVGSKHQVVIPKKVREQLGIEPGDYVEISHIKSGAMIKRKALVDVPETDEKLGPKTRAGIKQALKEMKEGKAAPLLRTQKELREYFDTLKR